MFIFIIKRNFELPQKRMVEVDQDGDVDLEQRLSAAWQGMLGQQEAAAGFIAESHRKEFGGDAGQIAFFNNRLVSIFYSHYFCVHYSKFLTLLFPIPGHQ